MPILLFNLLWLIPLFVFFITSRQPPPIRLTLRFMAMGAVVWQASKGLLGFGFLGEVAVPFAFIAYLFESIHQFFIYKVAIFLGVASTQDNILDTTESYSVIVFGVFFI